jgi:hypothetical protein
MRQFLYYILILIIVAITGFVLWHHVTRERTIEHLPFIVGSEVAEESPLHSAFC